jgi:translation elongation factor EF-Tu-like GTPase
VGDGAVDDIGTVTGAGDVAPEVLGSGEIESGLSVGTCGTAAVVVAIDGVEDVGAIRDTGLAGAAQPTTARVHAPARPPRMTRARIMVSPWS